jgi:hypothetical protein
MRLKAAGAAARQGRTLRRRRQSVWFYLYIPLFSPHTSLVSGRQPERLRGTLSPQLRANAAIVFGSTGMKAIFVALIAALLAAPAFAQAPKKVPAYGETEKDKTPEEKRAEREAEKAYERSLGNIPTQKAVDPWGNVRGDAPKETKAPAAKKTKTGASGAQPQ